MSNKIKNDLKKKGYIFNSNYSVIGRVDAIHIDENQIFKEIKENYDLEEFFKIKLPNYRAQAALYSLIEIYNNNNPTKTPPQTSWDSKKFIKSAHDVSLGGIITALSKMCIKGKKGATLKKQNYLINQFEYLFGEDQGRYIVEISKDDLESATKILQENSVHFDELGSVNDDSLLIDEKTKVSIDDLIKSHTNWLTNYMEN